MHFSFLKVVGATFAMAVALLAASPTFAQTEGFSNGPDEGFGEDWGFDDGSVPPPPPPLPQGQPAPAPLPPPQFSDTIENPPSDFDRPAGGGGGVGGGDFRFGPGTVKDKESRFASSNNHKVTFRLTGEKRVLIKKKKAKDNREAGKLGG